MFVRAHVLSVRRAHEVQDGSIIHKKWVSIDSLFSPSYRENSYGEEG